ncbi:MAG: RNA polymerase sigma factor [Verrucomicrobiota bacterium]
MTRPNTFAIQPAEFTLAAVVEPEPDSSSSDRALLRALKRKSSPALRALLEKYESSLIGYLESITCDHALAQDLAQECFLKLIKKPPFTVGNGSLKPWLFKVGRNLAIDQLRTRKRVDLHEQVPETSAHSPIKHDKLDPADARMLIQKLPDDMRQIVSLRIYADFTYKEISSQLKTPLGTVLWKMNQAVARMRNMLETDQS